MNTQIADELYALRNNNYDCFMDLLFDIKNNTTVNSRQLKILIELDFFEEFGDANLLMNEYKVFDEYFEKSQIRKEAILRSGIPEYIFRNCSEKETEKM